QCPVAPRLPAAAKAIAQIEKAGALFGVYRLAPESRLRCRVMGNPALLEGSRFRKEHCRTMEFPDSAFAIGLGALGAGFDDCRGRFGEVIAAAGAGACLSTAGSN